MLKNKKIRILFLVLCLIFSFTFYFGVFANPNFNINDFCMNLSSEIIGLVIVVVFVDKIIEGKKK